MLRNRASHAERDVFVRNLLMALTMARASSETRAGVSAVCNVNISRGSSCLAGSQSLLLETFLDYECAIETNPGDSLIAWVSLVFSHPRTLPLSQPSVTTPMITAVIGA